MSFHFNGFPFGMGGDGFGFGDAAAEEAPKKDVNTTRYYEILGVSKTATHDEIRKAYRKKAVKLHPDKGGSEEAFQELQQAYEVLSDDDKRKVLYFVLLYSNLHSAALLLRTVVAVANGFLQLDVEVLDALFLQEVDNIVQTTLAEFVVL